jgi:hypothetical protein
LLPDVCQAAVSKPVIWVSFAANVSTDMYLISIPLPMLWESRMKTLKKIASTFVLGAGVFVLVCATLKSIFVLVVSLDAVLRCGAISLIVPPYPQDPVNGPALAGEWGTREAFVAVITTNLPMLFPLFKLWLSPLFSTLLRSSQKTYKTPSGFRTIGGGGGGEFHPAHRRGPASVNPITANLSTYSESEERMVGEVKLEDLKVSASPASDSQPPSGILVSNQVDVTHEEITSRNGQLPFQRVHESW